MGANGKLLKGIEIMKAIVYDKKNKESNLSLMQVAKPVLNEDEILIEVYASSVNAADYRLLKMGIAPKKKIFGADFSGIVCSVGKNISKFKVGDEVCGDLSNDGFGGFAEFVAVRENAIVSKPDNVTFEEAASIPLAGITALQALCDRGNIKAGDNVLIVGSSGGVGTYAIQLAKHYGGSVTCVCSNKNHKQAKELGADHIIDYKSENFQFEENKFDLVLAINGDYPLSTYKKSLKENGKFVLVGGSLTQIFKNLLFGKLMSLGSKKMLQLFAKSNQKDIEFLLSLVKEKKIKPVIEKIYSLEQAIEGISYVSEGHASGKVVIRIK